MTFFYQDTLIFTNIELHPHLSHNFSSRTFNCSVTFKHFSSHSAFQKGVGKRVLMECLFFSINYGIFLFSVDEVFSNVAENYDVMNDAMSFGVHRCWKDLYISRLAPTRGTKLLDVAGGTGMSNVQNFAIVTYCAFF